MTQLLHVIPLNDLMVHHESTTCPCNPQQNEDGVVVHNAFDGREFKEGDE
jgi:hypothetical protein